MSRKRSNVVSWYIIIIVTLIVFAALSNRGRDSQNQDRERTPDATEVITTPEQLGAGLTKVINTSQGKPESDVSKLSEPSDSNETPALKQFSAGHIKVIIHPKGIPNQTYLN